jgi:hypothetical protein
VLSYKSILLKEVVACLDYNVVFVAEDGRDLVGDPLLHQVNVDLFNVDLLIELRWKLSRLETLLVDAERHADGGSRTFGCVRLGTCCVDGIAAKVEVSEVASSRLRLGGSAKAVRSYVSFRYEHGGPWLHTSFTRVTNSIEPSP